MGARLLRFVLILAAGLALALVVALVQTRIDRAADRQELSESFAAGGKAGVIPGVEVGGPFELTDQTGRTVTDQMFRGKLMLVYFGYAYCPDICPTDLQEIALAMDELGEQDAAEVQPLFITIDPERDTVASLSRYVGLFHPRLLGLTGTDEQIAQAAKGYRVFYRKAPSPGGAPDEYLMDHSTYSYLMGRDGKLLTVFAHGTTPETIAKAVRQHLKD